jgi:hypothetical protein
MVPYLGHHPVYLLQEKIVGKYCDSKVLERNWFNWLLASSVPGLEEFRKSGILWTKVIGTVKKNDNSEILRHGKPLADPSYPTRSHCVALGHPVYLNSYYGIPQNSGTVFIEGSPVSVEVSSLYSELHLLSDSWVHNLINPLSQQEVLPHIVVNGYIKEMPAEISWHAMLNDIGKICQGIAANFRQPSDEERSDLAHEALLQVSNKLKNRKLIYIPGKAPVFNLLTTTIHRCMYSIMNRRTNRRKGQARLLEDAQAGILPDHHRSLRTPIRQPIRTR